MCSRASATYQRSVKIISFLYAGKFARFAAARLRNFARILLRGWRGSRTQYIQRVALRNGEIRRARVRWYTCSPYLLLHAHCDCNRSPDCNSPSIRAKEEEVDAVSFSRSRYSPVTLCYFFFCVDLRRFVVRRRFVLSSVHWVTENEPGGVLWDCMEHPPKLECLWWVCFWGKSSGSKDEIYRTADRQPTPLHLHSVDSG